MSTLEVDKIIPQGSGTALQIGENGDTITLPAGTTITLPSGSISNSELDERIFVYNEYESNIMITNLANILVNVFVFNEDSSCGDCVGIIINKNTRSITRAFM